MASEAGAERTELDSHFENLLQRADKTEEHTRRLLSAIESYLQPNPTVRMEEVFYEKLELKKDGVTRQNNLEHLATAMSEAGDQFGSTTPYGSALVKVSQTQQRLGQAERELCAQAASHTLLPIRRFLEGDMKTIQKERKGNSNSKTGGGFSVEQAEADLRVAQAEFDKQAEITKLLLEGIQTAHNNQFKCLRDFVEAQMSFYAQAHQLMADLQRELSGSLSDTGISFANPVHGRPGEDGDSIISRKFGNTCIVEPYSQRSSFASAYQAQRRRRAVLDYDAIMPNEISVKQNDILIVYRLPGMDPEYVMAEKNGVRGRIPITYLELI
ncbi:unnamed protein product [Caenorhabditis auriculariae]|uniref:SH3 domain-containing GRB2-like protein B1 n=1 Tax=Caenorhabditis auriculariae TaxID=2777116 RepID=A0A8S1GQ57_9PELO|nr:unnamed protein product [Caenorhabditis auriculariae]